MWYAALGDSITTPENLSDPSLAYPAVFAKLIQTSLVSTAVIAEDLSIGGTKVIDMLGREIPLIDPRTTLVTMMIGHNDIWPIRNQVNSDRAGADFNLANLQQAYIDDIAAIKRAVPNARIIVANFRNLDRINAQPSPDLDYVLARINAMIANLQQPGVSVLDLQCGFPDQYKISYFTDWVHMTAQGHAAVANHFFDVYTGIAAPLATSCAPTVVP